MNRLEHGNSNYYGNFMPKGHFGGRRVQVTSLEALTYLNQTHRKHQ